jgi:DNA-binding NarL/FixJ family response regulator
MPERKKGASPRKIRSTESISVARRTANRTPDRIRILILEDNEADAELVRHELRRSGLSVITDRVDSEDGFAAALREFEPDVVLSDHSLAQFDAQSALALLRKVRPTIPLIIVTGHPNSDDTIACLRAGAEDLLTKGNLGRLAASITDALELRRPLHALTPRQVEVLRLVAEGHRTRDIATRLKLSVKTVESHRGEVMKRLEIHDVVNLVRYALRVGLVSV